MFSTTGSTFFAVPPNCQLYRLSVNIISFVVHFNTDISRTSLGLIANYDTSLLVVRRAYKLRSEQRDPSCPFRFPGQSRYLTITFIFNDHIYLLLEAGKI